MLKFMIDMMEKGMIPDALIRVGIRDLCATRLKELKQDHEPLNTAHAYIHMLKSSPMAVATDAANRQHYEVPAQFYNLVLGKNKKYSCSYWQKETKTLDEAEGLALDITMNRADIQDGMDILELGCGWGSLTLAMAQRYPHARIVALSNSASQKAYIDLQAIQRGYKNVKVLTRDMGRAQSFVQELGQFDRVVSVEMFEHIRNYEMLFQCIQAWLKPSGKLFTHIFTHKDFSYLFETEGDDNWMGKYFFTGGQMPAQNLFAYFQKHLLIEKTWSWNGQHYQKTSEAWLNKMDSNKEEIYKLFCQVYGEVEAGRWVQRWRVFFLACAELFGYDKGSEWGVSHYLFTKRDS